MDRVTNVGKGQLVHYAGLPGGNDGLVGVVLVAVGLPSDDVLQDYGSLSALLAGAATEHPGMGRRPLTGVTTAVDDTANEARMACDDLSWEGVSGAPAGKLVICYVPDVEASTDAELVPLVLLDFAVTPTGGDVMARVHADGLAVAS